MSHLDDDELLTQLGAALAATDVAPDEVLRERLLSSLEAPPVTVLGGGFKRRFARHASAWTISLAGVVALGGVAAAAVATDTLPGPTRALAYDLGLPVTSPALAHARADLSTLRDAIAQRDARAASVAGQRLSSDLSTMHGADLSTIRDEIRPVLAAAEKMVGSLGLSGLGLVSPSTTTTTSTSASTATTTSAPSTTTTGVVPSLPVVGPVVGGITKNLSGPGGTISSSLP